jgi:hypothetical protein
LACIDQRYVLYQELMLELVFIFGMIWNIELELTIDM